MSARDLPGTAVAVVRDGEVVHLAGYGVADAAGRSVTPDTPFVVGSVSKPFTAVVVDASVALIAAARSQSGPTALVTSDPTDLRHLLQTVGASVRLVAT